MRIKGYAFEPNEKELMEEYAKRYKEIKHLRKELNIEKYPKYGHTEFKGQLLTPVTKDLSELDLALLADDGNLCFGGECTKGQSTFSGSYNTE
ncbi:MAG: hypothetical protein SCALA702_01730 [Melioribacteraceae bacterium]|nr:MAG: hypothetical protein SCALA702_01730 [Melioribacteraceae bacterium]